MNPKLHFHLLQNRFSMDYQKTKHLGTFTTWLPCIGEIKERVKRLLTVLEEQFILSPGYILLNVLWLTIKI